MVCVGASRGVRLLLIGLGACSAPLAPPERNGRLQWEQMLALPATPGVAAPFAGAHAGVVLIAGGANFPTAPPWAGGVKVWHDSIWVGDPPRSGWRVAGRLPSPLAYGVSISTADGLIAIGGSDASRHHARVFSLTVDGGEPVVRPLPSLPHPLANACGALVGRSILVAGGTTSPDATVATATFLKFDLEARANGWQTLPSWPGPSRMLAVAAATATEFVLIGGVDLSAGDDGRPVRRYLRDAYCWHPTNGWRRLPDLPRDCAAAPSPAPVLRDGTILLLGGDDGSQVGIATAQHRGFAHDVQALDPHREQWYRFGTCPAPRVTTPVVEFADGWLIPSGEARPGVRSPEVWHLRVDRP